MNYIGIDSHKRYSICSAIDESGEIIHETRIEGNDAGEFAAFVSRVGGLCRAVLETGCFWAKIHDIFEEIEGFQEVILAHAYKTRGNNY